MAPKATTTIPAPPPPAPVPPAAPVVDNAPATPPPPPAPPVLDPDGNPSSTGLPADPEAQAGATNVNEAQPGTSGGEAPQVSGTATGVGEIDGGAPEASNSDALSDALAGETPQEYSERKKRETEAASPNGAEPQRALQNGGVKASDYKAPDPDVDDEFAETPDDKFGKRTTKISHSAFKAGRRGVRLGKQRKSMSDAEWEVYKASHARGAQQAEADELSGEDRLARIERALGLMIPNAPDPFDEDDE